MTLHGHALRMLAACAFAVATRLAPASADVITEWNEVATTTLHPASSIVELRALASAHGAAFDAVNGFEGRYTPYLVDVKPPSGASAEAAAAAAIHGVLAALLPTQKEVLETTHTKLLGKIPDGPAKDAGITFGREVADAHIAARMKDKMDGKAEHIPGTEAGHWRPTPHSI